ncbi:MULTISPECIES: hypothetical protein [unclassified Coleofasciculus]|uniref:hypothetical protein n=1 Tax=unclassified Coleofasciculus TaxID=2692782 RepID=UPI00188041BB|nr:MULTISPECIES: hypothetical protein [unclassified Coleofasciculus]MBE9126463.1 hypothetical protein [Coleofasciculus sp. LEGE 07081]MBE9148901.1 hypothetical protein [Coleofasciculus sp. LEGE 07092]
MQIPENVTFEDAIALTESLMTKMDTGELSQTEAADAIAQLVKTQNGARGFFVTYLTPEGTLADNPSPEIIQALQSSPDTVSELLVKNLAMSAAMAITHRRNNNEEMAQGSDRVRMRTANLIERVELPQVRELALKLRESAVTGEGSYKTFLERWQYDAEQREIIRQTIDRVIV